MTYRRTWFSCVLWFLYTVLCIVLLAVEGKEWLQHFAGIGPIFPQIIYGLLVIPVAVLYWSIRGISTRIRTKWEWKEHTKTILECIIFLLIMAGALLVRIMSLNYATAGFAAHSFDINILPEISVEYYNMAAVTENGFTASMDYGISDLYVMLLSFVFSFLGNKAEAAIFLQIILQIAGIILVYASTRRLAGRLPACIAALYLAGSEASLGMLEYFEPAWLFFDLYMIGMLIVISFVKAYLANHIPKPVVLIGAVAVGAVIGGLTYLDLTAASLLVAILIVALGKKKRQENLPIRNSISVSAMVIWMSFLACAAVWFGAMNVLAYMNGTDLSGDIRNRLWLCYENSYLFTGQRPYSWDIYLVGVLIIPASFLAFEYFRSGKEQNYMPWILLCLLAAPTPLTVYGEHGFGVLSLYVWAVLAGLGLQNCILGGREKVMQAVIEDINMAAKKDEPEKAGQTVSAAGIEQAKQTVSTETVAGERETKSMENQRTKPRYIENPLPLPKKHVAKEMDYLYEVDEKDMKYDVEISPNDDFDLK